MFKFLLVVNALVAAALVGVILMQRSEGGGLAGGGSPTGLLSARGAGDFLTRTTAILATLFIALSIGMAAFATIDRGPRELDNSLNRTPVNAPPVPTLPAVPMGGGATPAPMQAPNVAAPVPQPVDSIPAAAKVATPKPQPVQQTRPTEKREAAPAPKAAVQPVKLPAIIPAQVSAPKLEAPAPAGAAPKTDAPQ